MANERIIFEMIEIDVPFCSLTWGVGACTAVLSGTSPRKCWNLRNDCRAPLAYTEGAPLTLRFCKDGPIPRGLLAFPVLSRVSASSPTVNIAGSDPSLSSLGKLATLDFTLADFTYHERGIDPYAAERLTGAAQFSGMGYDPAKQGTFLNKLKARWPYYADKPCRYIKGYIDAGVLVEVQTQHYYLKDFDGPNDGDLRVKAYGVLDLANAKTALCPKPSKGRLDLDLSDVATSFTVTPAGVGAEYAASGWLCIGSEIMAFTRSVETFTVVRGQRGTTARAHKQGDTVQQTYSTRGARLDTVAHDLVQNFTETPADYLDAGQMAENAAEVTRWGASIVLETDIVTPTPVATLLSELSDLGATIFEDEFDRKLRLRMNRPIYDEVIRKVSDRTARDIRQKDKDEDRLTQILFMSKRIDPTKTLTDDTNYSIKILTTDPVILGLHGGIVKSRTIRTRWLDQGDEATIAVASLRLLDRFKRAPKEITIELDARERALRLVDVLEVTSDELADGDGLPKTQYVQVIGRTEPVAYHNIKAICQAFQFDGRYAFIAPDTAPVYSAATDEEKQLFAFIAPDADGFPSDLTPAYQVI